VIEATADLGKRDWFRQACHVDFGESLKHYTGLALQARVVKMGPADLRIWCRERRCESVVIGTSGRKPDNQKSRYD